MHYIKPPYNITSEILNLLTKISEKIGALNAIQLNRPPADHTFKPLKLKSLLDAHKILMKGLIPNAGKFRRGNVGIVKGSKVTHVAGYSSIHLMTEMGVWADYGRHYF